MSSSLLPKNHFSLNINNDIETICKPLNKYGITYFAHARYYSDNTAYFLTNHRNSYYHHIQKEYVLVLPILTNMVKNKLRYLVTANNAGPKFNQGLYDYINIFNISYPFYFFEKGVGYLDMFIFGGASNDYGLVNCFINNIDILESFIAHFKEKSYKLQVKASKNRLILPKHMQIEIHETASNDNSKDYIQGLNEKKEIINYLLQLHFDTKLTTRELQSLGYLLRGRTAVETAQALNISPKTVESYIDSVKNKLSCLNRAELFDKFIDINLVNIITKL